MPRSDPTRSDYCATRHLLRHLHDARALRRNPLALPLLQKTSDADGLAAVSAATGRALASMDAESAERRWRTARHTVILLRMDVGREPVGAVARDLGLSERQLRRERRTAHARFLRSFRTRHLATAAVHERAAQVQIDRAERLADSGEARSALAILDDVAQRASDSSARCLALVRAANIETELHRLDVAGRRLQDAQRLIAEHVVPVELCKPLEREHRVGALQIEWFEVGPAVIASKAQRAQEPADARLWMLRACAALRGGDALGARMLAAAARSALDRCDDAGLRLDFEILEAELAHFIDGDAQRAQRSFARVVSLAGEQGFGGRRLWASHLLAFTHWLHTQSVAARSAYRTLVDGIDGSMPEQHRLMLYFSAADIELAIGSPRRALRAARSASQLATNDYERLSADALIAGTQRRLGLHAAAERTASETANGARRIGYLRVVSTAQRIAAEAALARGDRYDARERIDEALRCAAGRTSLYVLALTHDVAARITRDRRHLAAARELRATAVQTDR
jgi:hypothetical protein